MILTRRNADTTLLLFTTRRRLRRTAGVASMTMVYEPDQDVTGVS